MQNNNGHPTNIFKILLLISMVLKLSSWLPPQIASRGCFTVELSIYWHNSHLTGTVFLWPVRWWEPTCCPSTPEKSCTSSRNACSGSVISHQYWPCCQNANRYYTSILYLLRWNNKSLLFSQSLLFLRIIDLTFHIIIQDDIFCHVWHFSEHQTPSCRPTSIL